LSGEKGWKRELIEDIGVIAITLFLIWGTGISLQIYLQTPTPLLAVESGSMEPVLYRGDFVIVRGVDPATLQVGDIVIYDAASLDSTISDVPIVHRIIDIQNESGELYFFTKGDNNPGPDYGNRTSDDIIAKVIGSIRYLGFLTLLLLEPIVGLGSVIVLIVVFLVTSVVCDTFTPPKAGEEPEKNKQPV
jgi:signal peptidase